MKIQKLSLHNFKIVSDTVRGVFDNEIMKLIDKKDHEVISRFFYEFYLCDQLHCMLLNRRLSEIVEMVFNNISIRDFILNLTDKIAILLSVNEIDEELIIGTLVNGLCINKEKTLINNTVSNSLSLIPEQLKQAIYLDGEELVNLFKSNYWLVVLVLVHIFFNETETFKESIKNNQSVK